MFISHRRRLSLAGERRGRKVCVYWCSPHVRSPFWPINIVPPLCVFEGEKGFGREKKCFFVFARRRWRRAYHNIYMCAREGMRDCEAFFHKHCGPISIHTQLGGEFDINKKSLSRKSVAGLSVLIISPRSSVAYSEGVRGGNPNRDLRKKRRGV